MSRNPDPARTRHVAMLAAVIVLAVPLLAGCIGGGGETGGGTVNDTDTNDTLPGNGTLDPDAFQAHVHDRWINPATGESVTEITLVDETVTIEPVNTTDPASNPIVLESCEQSRGGPQDNRNCFGWAEFLPGTWANGDWKVVPPATERVDVTLTFDATSFAGMDFWYQHRSSQGIWSILTNETNGGPFMPGGDNRSISVNLFMSDDGHAQVSSWKFGISPLGDPYTGGENGYLDIGSGQVQVEIIAYRQAGQLPLEPPHPLYWDADDPPTDTYLIGRLQGSTSGFTQIGPMLLEPDRSPTPKFGGQGLRWEVPVGFEGRHIEDRAEYPPKMTDEFAAALVPPASKLLAVHVEVPDATVQAGSPQLCVLGQDVPGEGFPGGNSRDAKLLGECQTFQSGLSHTFTKPINNRDTDSFYVNASSGISMSRWTFYVQVIAPELAGGQRGVASFSGEVVAHIFVTDQATFEMPAWANVGGGGGGDGA